VLFSPPSLTPSSLFLPCKEPHTRFSVHSELGGDSFKFKDIPKLSKFIIKKLKGEIVKKMVDPNVHRWARHPWY
jgi:hypothetical protein